MIESVELSIRQAGQPDRSVALTERVTVLGRSEDCGVPLADIGVSRRHARVVWERDRVIVEDLGSGNGTFFRGQRVEHQVVHDGDEIVIDPFVLRFRVRGDVRPSTENAAEGPAARLDVVRGPGMRSRAYPIPPSGLTVGRSETRDVVISDPACSRHHFSVFFQDGRYVLRDMGSANGVIVNAARVRECVLTSDDYIRVGNTELRFVVDDRTWVDGQAPGLHREDGPPGGPWDDGWTADVALPEPEADQGEGGFEESTGQWVSVALGGATVLTFMTLVMAVSGLLLFVVYNRARGPEITTRPSDPPNWHVGSAEVDGSAETRFEAGLAAMRRRDHAEALSIFYDLLRAYPNHAAAERFAFVAGEYLVLGGLEEELDRRRKEWLAREAVRDALLQDAEGEGTASRAVREILEAEYADDPVVVEALGLEASPYDAGPGLHEADRLVEQGRLDAAADRYLEVRTRASQPRIHGEASAGLRRVERQQAILVAEDWRRGVLAEAAGDLSAATEAYRAVLERDRRNPSARARLEGIRRRGEEAADHLPSPIGVED